MAARTVMQRFARWHIWLGWLAAIPLVLWTASGLFMTLRPIDEVRGTNLRAKAVSLDPGPVVMPKISEPIARLELVALQGQPHWVSTMTDGSKRSYSAQDGSRNPPVSIHAARRIAEDALAARPALEDLQFYEAAKAPLDLRRDRPSWQARFVDGTHVYIDADTGEVLALRTRFWRAFDFMWGLHIMDPMGRENTSHFLLWLFGAVALVTSLIGTTLLFRRRRALR